MHNIIYATVSMMIADDNMASTWWSQDINTDNNLIILLSHSTFEELNPHAADKGDLFEQ